jgi:uncharacterized OB-fold protein
VTRAPAIEGWFTLAEEPHLLGTRCIDSGTYYFPPETTMSRAPGAAASALEPVELSRTGTLWSYTNAGYPPPEPYVPVTDPFEPFCIAAVELAAERMVVLGQCVAGVTVDDLHVGMEMELVIDTLFTEDGDDGPVERLVWKWKPIEWPGAGANGEEKAR